ncbi:hypothetical protein KY347_04325 [Candidatus Woesearchaeota archaeon]|nr:hypothetical protein [Candidatus Woesearchaeota archaeon]
MEGKEARKQLLSIFGQQLKFNKEFDKYAEQLKEGMLQDFFAWCTDCKNDLADRSTPPKKKYRHLLVFFRKIASDIRVTLIKEKNKDFIEIILSGHRCYDDTRMKLGYKKSSCYGS